LSLSALVFLSFPSWLGGTCPVVHSRLSTLGDFSEPRSEIYNHSALLYRQIDNGRSLSDSQRQRDRKYPPKSCEGIRHILADSGTSAKDIRCNRLYNPTPFPTQMSPPRPHNLLTLLLPHRQARTQRKTSCPTLVLRAVHWASRRANQGSVSYKGTWVTV
jgi:hypothetical protein